jgi:hypothetical protein
VRTIPGHVQGVVEALGDPDRLLPRHGVGHEEDLLGGHGVPDPSQLLHEGLVDLEPPRRVHDEHGPVLLPGRGQGFTGRGHRIASRRSGVDRHLDPLGQRGELLHGGGPDQVAGGEHGLPPLAAEATGQLRRRRRLPRALQPHDQDDRGGRRSPLEARLSLAQERGQLVVDDLHDLLARGDGLQDRLAQRPGLHLLQELPGDLVVHVGLQENPSDLPEPVLDHGLVEHPALAKPAQHGVQLVAQLIEHERSSPLPFLESPSALRRGAEWHPAPSRTDAEL